MKKNSQKRKFGTILLSLAALFAVLFSTAACKTDSDDDELNSVTISPSEATINAKGEASLYANVDKKGSGTPVYKWEITSGGEYATLKDETSSTCVVTGKNTTASAQSVKVKCTVTFASTTKEAEATVTVSAAKVELESVSIAGSAEIESGAETELTATPAFTIEGASPTVTYTWTISAGSDYAKLSESTTGTVKLTAKNTTTSGKTVTVKVSASDGTNSVESTCTVTVGAAAAVESYDINVVPGASVTTYGWADVGNMAYPDTKNIIYIGDDGYKVGSGKITSYTTSQTKRLTFTNAIASGSVSSATVNTTPAIIILSGTVDLSDGKISDTDHSYYDSFDSSTHKRNHGDITYEIGSNKTILGVNSAKIAFGGLKIYANKAKRENIIIRNIIFWDAHGSTEEDTSYNSKSKASVDNLVLECNSKDVVTDSNGFVKYNNVPTNIWIDHCVFTDGTCSDLERNFNHDGSLDMKAGKNVTVSYCEFTNHDKVTLLAPGDKYVDPEQRQITFHHNYYHDAVQRMPRSRGCQLHIYNNYYNAIGTSGNGGYALGPGIGSQFIVEGNYFGSFQQKIVQYADSSASASASTLSKFYQKDNSKTLTSSDVKFDSAEKVKDWSAHETSTAPWTIAYSYTADSYSDLPSLIPSSAGTDKSGYSKIINVNGTVYGN